MNLDKPTLEKPRFENQSKNQTQDQTQVSKLKISISTKPLYSVLVMGMGMVGLYHNIEYSGWILFLGVLGYFDSI